MKHNFLAWRYLDASAAETKGGAILDAVQKNHKETLEQIQGIKTAQEKALDEAKNELQEEISSGKATAQKALEKAEEIEKKMATSGMGGNVGFQKSYQKEFEEKLTENKDHLGKGAKFSIELGRKAVGDMGAHNLTGAYFVPPTVVPGVFVQPFNEVHMRNLLTTGTTNSNVIRHIRDNGGEGGPAMVAEGATKPEMDRDLSIEDANVRKIATYLRVPEEMIEDIPYLTSFLTEVGTEEVLAVEDTQILYGDGTGQNLSGLFTNATAFAAGGSVVTTPQEYDVIGAAAKQMRVAKRTPSFALVSPTDYYNMTSRKDSTGNYILKGGGNGVMPTIEGVPIIQLNQIANGDFLVMDRRSAQLFFRSNINVRFYEQDRDNAIKNMVTIVIEERLALPIYYTSGLVKGTFSTAITALTAP